MGISDDWDISSCYDNHPLNTKIYFSEFTRPSSNYSFEYRIDAWMDQYCHGGKYNYMASIYRISVRKYSRNILGYRSSRTRPWTNYLLSTKIPSKYHLTCLSVDSPLSMDCTSFLRTKIYGHSSRYCDSHKYSYFIFQEKEVKS